MDNTEINVSDLKTDDGIAAILNKLKSATPAINENTVQPSEISHQEDLHSDINETPAEAEQSDVQSVEDITVKPVDSNNDSLNNLELSVDSTLLPWFTEADKDIKSIHYITFDDSGNIQHNAIKSDTSLDDLAKLKLQPNYVCDIDYYKSKHFVLCVKQIESDYDRSRSFTSESESFKLARSSNIMLEDANSISDVNNPTLAKIPTETVSDIVACTDKYNHYVVFTDLGTIDFISRQDESPFPYGESNLSKWFEEISNYTQIKNAKYEPNSRQLSAKAADIKDFKYDIITMHRPGIITLDSVDNQDSNYQINIQLKDEYSFIPMNRILGCLKFYASHNGKSADDLRRMLNKYFNVI